MCLKRKLAGGRQSAWARENLWWKVQYIVLFDDCRLQATCRKSQTVTAYTSGPSPDAQSSSLEIPIHAMDRAVTIGETSWYFLVNRTRDDMAGNTVQYAAVQTKTTGASQRRNCVQTKLKICLNSRLKINKSTWTVCASRMAETGSYFRYLFTANNHALHSRPYTSKHITEFCINRNEMLEMVKNIQ